MGRRRDFCRKAPFTSLLYKSACAVKPEDGSDKVDTKALVRFDGTGKLLLQITSSEQHEVPIPSSIRTDIIGFSIFGVTYDASNVLVPESRHSSATFPCTDTVQVHVICGCSLGLDILTLPSRWEFGSLALLSPVCQGCVDQRKQYSYGLSETIKF